MAPPIRPTQLTSNEAFTSTYQRRGLGSLVHRHTPTVKEAATTTGAAAATAASATTAPDQRETFGAAGVAAATATTIATPCARPWSQGPQQVMPTLRKLLRSSPTNFERGTVKRNDGKILTNKSHFLTFLFLCFGKEKQTRNRETRVCYTRL